MIGSAALSQFSFSDVFPLLVLPTDFMKCNGNATLSNTNRYKDYKTVALVLLKVGMPSLA